ncbi:AAEL010887-PA [Aedes aegypti]|uniref:AAEL010887-PA n=1 Tax=Aedes aegypti TaxID=7159 RepID=Q16RP4_AEDAE|nr:AAEL010887-PA [Aedes aegypti]
MGDGRSRGSSSSSHHGGSLVYVGNIPKAASEDQLRKFFNDCKGIVSFSFRLDDCTYCPTKIAFVKFANRYDEDRALRMNQTFFQGKRIFVANVDTDRNFTPRYAIMVKQLNEYITEEDVYDHFKNIGAIECVQKPAVNYAYVSFERSESTQRALAIKNRNLKGVDIEVFPVKRNISMMLEKPKLLTFADIQDKCEAMGLRYEPEAETQTKLLVTNIPRHVPEEEVIDYLGKFGKIVDWEMQKSPISVLTNIGYVTYLNPKTARFVYLFMPHNFQGVALDIYNPRITYGEIKSTTAVLLKRTNVYLTNDEIFQAMNECGRVAYIHRVDSARYCTIVRFMFSVAVMTALKVKRIADENVYITRFSEQSYLSEMAPIPEVVPKSNLRLHKESMLRKMIEKEDQAELSRVRTIPNVNYVCPNAEFYKNEVLVMNYPPGTALVQFRDYFKKCGNVINFRQTDKAVNIKQAFLSFDTRLEARRACTMNQNFMAGKRLLIHMANESLYLDPELCVLVAGLNTSILDEDIYDRFSDIGNVKFVLRQSPGVACVCMEHKRWYEAALRVIMVNTHRVIVNRVSASASVPVVPGPGGTQQLPQMIPVANDQRPNLRAINLNGPRGTLKPVGPTENSGPVMGPRGPLQMGPRGPMMGPGGPMGGPMMGPGGPMIGPGGSMMGPGGPMMGPGGPMMGPGGPMMGPGGPMMGPGGPMMGSGGPMMGPCGPMMGPGGPPGPIMGPGDPMMGPGGPMMGPRGVQMMGPGAPMNQSSPNRDSCYATFDANPTAASDNLAPWQTKASKLPIETETSDDSIYATVPLSAQDRFEKAEKLRLESDSKESKNPDVMSVSSDSDSDSIPPAPEPPQFSTRRSRSASPELPSSLRRARSRSPYSYQRRSRSRSLSHTRWSRSPRGRTSLSPFSKALLSSPLLRYDRSVSKSPDRYHRSKSPVLRTVYRSDRLRSRSRSPVYRSRSRSPKKTNLKIVQQRSNFQSRSKSGSPLSLSPAPLTSSTKMWDDPSQPKEPARYTFQVDGHKETSNCIFVGNLPSETTEEQMVEIFGKFGQILSVKFAINAANIKRAFLTFDTYDQAVKALDMHLRQYRGHLLRVAFAHKMLKERPGFSVSIVVKGNHYNEIDVFNTFKLCGDISYLWTRSYKKEDNMTALYHVIDFKHRDAVRVALETHKLVNGSKCKVGAIVR